MVEPTQTLTSTRWSCLPVVRFMWPLLEMALATGGPQPNNPSDPCMVYLPTFAFHFWWYDVGKYTRPHWVDPGELTNKYPKSLVGGWTNPVEKSAQIGCWSLGIPGWKFQKCLEPPRKATAPRTTLPYVGGLIFCLMRWFPVTFRCCCGTTVCTKLGGLKKTDSKNSNSSSVALKGPFTYPEGARNLVCKWWVAISGWNNPTSTPLINAMFSSFFHPLNKPLISKLPSPHNLTLLKTNSSAPENSSVFPKRKCIAVFPNHHFSGGFLVNEITPQK